MTFDIQSWPVSDECKNLLESMKNKYIVRPIPVYHPDGHLLKPEEYESCIPGAIVEVNFIIVSRNFLSKNSLVISAVLQEMQIVRLPRVVVQNTKRKLTEF